MQQERPRGLLLDVDVKNADFFTAQLSLTESENLLKDKMCIYNVLMEGAVENSAKFDETLEKVVERAKSFIRSKNLWNREKFQCALEDVIKETGEFVCVLGGKNTGKSLVMENMESLEDKVFVIDHGRNPDILGSLIEKLW